MYRFDTIAVHAGGGNDPLTGAVVAPIYQTTTFGQDEPGGDPAYCYGRTGNPTRTALETALAALEGARFGFAFASGLAAANALVQTLSAGDHIVASQDLYGGCWRLFTRIYRRLGIRFTFVDATDLSAVEGAIEPATKLLWLETPSNPLLKITDIAACSTIAHERGVRVVVDNTFATPVHQRPLQLGADIVLHSTTKYIGGHCDVLGGALITNDEASRQEIKFVQNATGGVPGPQDCFLLLRGIRTLPLRFERHCAGAATIAQRLDRHGRIRRVIYPGLVSHPQRALAVRQARGFGAVLSIEVDGGIERIGEVVRRLSLWTLAESLGGVKSLLCHPATMTHASVEPEERRRIGIGDGLIRLSVGLEDPEDLLEDLERALDGGRVVVAPGGQEVRA
jgi:cystathionine beta-lyase/cystathionine gamma-synthase